MPEAKIPKLDIPNVDIEKAAGEIVRAARDVAYTAVGIGVLGFQRAQVQRVELAKRLDVHLGELPGAARTLVDTIRHAAGRQ